MRNSQPIATAARKHREAIDAMVRARNVCSKAAVIARNGTADAMRALNEARVAYAAATAAFDESRDALFAAHDKAGI